MTPLTTEEVADKAIGALADATSELLALRERVKAMEELARLGIVVWWSDELKWSVKRFGYWTKTHQPSYEAAIAAALAPTRAGEAA